MATSSAPPADIAHACRVPGYSFAFGQFIDRVPERDVAADLMEKGFDQEGASEVAKHAKRLLEEAKMAPANARITIGILLILLGAGTTWVSLASALESGGSSVIWYGPILFGALFAGRGFRLRRHPNMHGLRDFVERAIEAARSGDGTTKNEATHQAPATTREYDY